MDTLQLLINKNGIFLEMSIASPENLIEMTDEFWLQLLEINQFGKLELTDNEAFDETTAKQYPEFFPKQSQYYF